MNWNEIFKSVLLKLHSLEKGGAIACLTVTFMNHNYYLILIFLLIILRTIILYINSRLRNKKSEMYLYCWYKSINILSFSWPFDPSLEMLVFKPWDGASMGSNVGLSSCLSVPWSVCLWKKIQMPNFNWLCVENTHVSKQWKISSVSF